MQEVNLEILFLSIMGSHAYGTNIETSDEDFRGVGVPKDSKYFYGLSSFEQQEYSETDKTVFSLKKFFQLASGGNPNILEILYQDNENLIKEKHELWEELVIPNRDIFLSQKVKAAYTGYAYAQVKRMENHRKWYDNPPDKPDEKDYQITPAEKYQLYKNIFMDYDHSRDGLEQRMKNFIDNMKDTTNVLAVKNVGSRMVVKYRDKTYEEQGKMFDTERYNRDLTEYHKYIDWKENRNETRSVLELKHGYDTKHASHCLRLLDQCEDIYRLGELRVCRPDRVELWRDIRAGKYSYEEFMDMYRDRLSIIDEISENSSLPKKPDYKKIEDLCVEIHQRILSVWQ